MVTLNKCPICKSKNINIFKKVFSVYKELVAELMPNIKVEVVPISIFFKCNNCGSIFQNPRMSDDELKVYYSNGYYLKSIDSDEAKIDNDEYGRAKYDSEIIKKYVANIYSHLDVGGGRGHLLMEFNAPKKVLIEPNSKHKKNEGVEYHRKINNDFVEQFDLVSAIHVLEHEPYPHKYLKKMVSLVKKGGYVVIEVPTWQSPGGSLRFAHLYHFEPQVLRKMCVDAGLKVINEELTPHFLIICAKL